MTGIEMLREWANELREVVRAYRDREIDYVPINVEACQRKNAAKLDAIADQIEREIDEAVADEVADTLSAYEMNTNARWYSAVEDGAESDCRAEYEMISRYWLPRPRFEDGTPVQFGDECAFERGVDVVNSITLYGNGRWHVLGRGVYGATSMDGPLKRPEPPKVLDADGVEIKVGDEVWGIGREQHAYKVLEPESGDECAHGRFTVKCVDLTYCELVVYADPSSLTHKRPEPPDTWERIEEDALKSTCEYYGHSEQPCETCPANKLGLSCGQHKTQDLVRRAEKLAGVDR